MSEETEDTGNEVALTADTGEASKLSEVEELASELGWKPQADYTGPEGKWKPAKDWIKGGRDIERGLKDTVKGLRDTVDRLAKSATKQTERMLNEQAAEINARFNSAVENKDAKAAAAASLEMQQLQREAVDETGGDVEGEFAKQNPWYGDDGDEDATAYAVAVSQREAKKGKTIPEQLEAVDKAVRKRFPELFETTPTKKAPPAVNTPSRGTPPARPKGFADLPPAAKEAAEKFAKLAVEKHGKKREDVLKQYADDYHENVQAA